MSHAVHKHLNKEAKPPTLRRTEVPSVGVGGKGWYPTEEFVLVEHMRNHTDERPFKCTICVPKYS